MPFFPTRTILLWMEDCGLESLRNQGATETVKSHGNSWTISLPSVTTIASMSHRVAVDSVPRIPMRIMEETPADESRHRLNDL